MEVIEVKRIQDKGASWHGTAAVMEADKEAKQKEAKQEISRRQVLNEDSKERQVFEEQQLETRLLPLVWTVVGLK